MLAQAPLLEASAAQRIAPLANEKVVSLSKAMKAWQGRDRLKQGKRRSWEICCLTKKTLLGEEETEAVEAVFEAVAALVSSLVEGEEVF